MGYKKYKIQNAGELHHWLVTLRCRKKPDFVLTAKVSPNSHSINGTQFVHLWVEADLGPPELGVRSLDPRSPLPCSPVSFDTKNTSEYLHIM